MHSLVKEPSASSEFAYLEAKALQHRYRYKGRIRLDDNDIAMKRLVI